MEQSQVPSPEPLQDDSSAFRVRCTHRPGNGSSESGEGLDEDGGLWEERRGGKKESVFELAARHKRSPGSSCASIRQSWLP